MSILLQPNEFGCIAAEVIGRIEQNLSREQPMRDRRQSERIPSILEGCLRQILQPCVTSAIRDLSVTGARIWLPGSVDLPGEFNLEIPVLEQAMPVRVMWSNGRITVSCSLGSS